MGKAMSLNWHRECLKNKQIYLLKKQEELKRLIQQVERDEKELLFYRIQIFNAEETGKERFDSDRYMKRIMNEKTD